MEKKQEKLENLLKDYRTRHKVYQIKRLNRMSDDEKKEAIKNISQEGMFLRKCEIFYGFYRKVKKDMGNVQWTKKHVDELTYLILLDLLHPDKSTMKNARATFKDFRENLDERMTTRQRRKLMREYYPEIFFTPPQSMAPDLDDKRQTPFRCIFQSLPRMDEEDKRIASMLDSIEDSIIHGKYPNLDKILKINAGLRMVEPEDMKSLRRFWKNSKRSLDAIIEKHGEPDEDKYDLISSIKNGEREMEVFHKLVWNAVSLRWFRVRKDNVKEELISKNYSLQYTRDDAKKAIEENLEWFEDPVQVFDLIERGAFSYISKEKPDAALYLYKEALKKIGDVDDYYIGRCHLNLSTCYKLLEEPEKALSELDKASDIFEDIGRDDLVGLSWAFRGEIYDIMEQSEKSNKAFKRSLDILKKADREGEEVVEIYLDIADCAARVGDRDLEKKALNSGVEELASAEETDDLFLYMNQRLMDVNKGKDSMKAEQGLGKIKHPSKFLWYNPTPDSFVPIHPVEEKEDEE